MPSAARATPRSGSWKPRSNAGCAGRRAIRRQKNGGDWSLLTILVSNVSISSVQHFTERSDWDAVTVVLGAASVGGLFHVRLGNASRRIVFLNASIYRFLGRRRNHR